MLCWNVQNTFKPQKSVETRSWKRKTTYQKVKLIIREAKMNPFISNTIFKKFKIIVMSHTIREHLVKVYLLARTSRSVSLLKKSNVKARKEFCRKYSAW